MHWATQLLSQCQAQHDAGRLSAANALETTAYTLVLNGRFLRYRDEFEDALAQLCVARGILDELAERAETSRDQALATCFADEVGPEIRYCAHELGHPRAYDVDNIVREQAARHRAQIVEGYDALVQKLRDGAGAGAGAGSKGDERRKLKTLLWEGEVVPVRNPELVDVLIKVQEGEVKLREESTEISEPARTTTGQEKKKRRPAKGGVSKRGVAAYDNVLLALSDAEEVARKLVEAQNVSNKWSHSQPSSTSLTRIFFHPRQAVLLLDRLHLASETFTLSTSSSSITFLRGAFNGICFSSPPSWRRTLRHPDAPPEAKRRRRRCPRKRGRLMRVFTRLWSSFSRQYFRV